MSVASALIESSAMSPTFVIALSLKDVAPKDTVPVAVKLLEPTSMLPKPLVIAPLLMHLLLLRLIMYLVQIQSKSQSQLVQLASLFLHR